LTSDVSPSRQIWKCIIDRPAGIYPPHTSAAPTHT